MKTLADLKTGEHAQIQTLLDPDTLTTERLRDLGFREGIEVYIIARSGKRGPLAARTYSGTFALRLAEAELILVR
jgi:Fe2+ transport system protein FeoA